MRPRPSSVSLLLVLALLLGACDVFADRGADVPVAAPSAAPVPSPTQSEDPEPPPALTVIDKDDPAAPYATRHAQTFGRQLVVGTTDEVMAAVTDTGTVDVQVLSSRGRSPVVDRDDLPEGTRVSRILVGDPDGWAVRLADGADRVLVTSDPTTVDGDPEIALLPLPDDLRAPGPINDFLSSTSATVELDDRDADHQWLLDTVTTSPALPGGGHLVYPGRRIVALYGHPGHSSLGVLGEQGPEAAVTRAREVAAQYEDGDLEVLPAFELIVTVAAGEAGADGDYSRETSIDDLRPWVDIARDEGLYVVLDLQPGRTDFLTQAKRYEELLLEPHVGLALDPEWRLGPNQVHLRQIGSVASAEVNQVADWLADLVRTNALPQKLFLVHQFKLTMIRERDALDASHPELAHAIQMDGQGAVGSKDETYRAITQGFTDRVWWGWKNFYDEDIPTPSPQHVLGLTPEAVFISYQ